MKPSPELTDAAWPAERLGECLLLLLQDAGLTEHTTAPQSPLDAADVSRWVSRAAEQLGCNTLVLEGARRDLRTQLRTACPALLSLGPDSYLALASSARSGRVLCLGQNGEAIPVDVEQVCDAIFHRADHGEGDRSQQLSEVLAAAKITHKQRSRVLQALSDEFGGAAPFRGCWMFLPAAGQPAAGWIKNSGAIRAALSLLAAHSLQYGLWLVAWVLLGRLSFSGRVEQGWLVAWALLLATAVPCRAMATWLQGVIPVLLGGQLKRRILQGALKLTPDEVRKGGIGSFLGQALEAEALESLALGGGIAGLLAVLDLAVSTLLVGRLAIALLAWFALAVAVGIIFLRRFEAWSGQRLEMTHDLVEAMVGQRTRLAQLHPQHWHEHEDQALAGYLEASCGVDRAGAMLVAAIPRGWLLAALGFLAPQLVAGSSGSGQLAAAVGGILLAFSAFDRIVSSFSEIAAAYVAWRRIAVLFQAAERSEGSAIAVISPEARPGIPILEADRLEFRYREHGPAVLESCGLTIYAGDRVLLEGESGGGKTTLAAMLSGARKPQSGLLLTGGLDIHSLGESGWRDRVVSAPQFHDNHILTETLAFNLLMGRRWPAMPSDFEEAETVCRQLGLGGLLDRMPGHLMQMVGDGGWQLSHGERSRIFIARALLQNPELVILDESFGSLDPETLAGALEATLQRAKSLVVIAHP